jgi:20S proteasome alpha/beta subunit
MIGAPRPRVVKPERLPERNAVTIIAGFRSEDGVVLCSDTQETISVAKRNVAKLKVHPEFDLFKILGGTDLMTAFCGAGYGPFIDLLTRRAWEAAEQCGSVDDAAAEIEKSIKNTHREYEVYRPYEQYYMNTEVIFGVKMEGVSLLFSAVGPIVNPVDYYAGGQGHYMADFLASRMYRSHLDLYQCVIIAAYVLLQAKEHVDGCGGASHIAVLRNQGESGLIDQARVDIVTELVGAVDRKFGEAIINASNLWIEKKEFDDTLRLMEDLVGFAREGAKEKIKQSEESYKLLGTFLGAQYVHDPLGFLIKQSTPQKSEDQP